MVWARGTRSLVMYPRKPAGFTNRFGRRREEVTEPDGVCPENPVKMVRAPGTAIRVRARIWGDSGRESFDRPSDPSGGPRCPAPHRLERATKLEASTSGKTGGPGQ